MMKYKFVVVGAGLSGLVMAERIANVLGEEVLIIEKKHHIGGATYDSYDDAGILVGNYGPHTFHTNDKEVFDYILQFARWNPYIHYAKSFVDGKFVSFPINKNTIKELYNIDLNDDDAAVFIKEHEDDLVDKFFRPFTFKQWGCSREELDQDVISRIPFRNNDDDRYFTDIYQGNPIGGYSKMFMNMTSNPKIKILLNTDYKEIVGGIEFDLLIYTGPIDYYFDYAIGKLLYRSVEFHFETYDMNSYQPVPSTRYPGFETKYTRVTEFKKMTGQNIDKTTILKEIPCFGEEPFYPYPTKKWKDLADRYRELAAKEEKTIFLGRLAEYRYYDMDDVVRKALDAFEIVRRRYENG